MIYFQVFSCGLLSLLFSLSAMAQIDCAADSDAVANVLLDPQANNSPANPYINQRHVFCGEVRNNAGKGFHARPGGQDPILVEGEGAARVTGQLAPSVQYPGVYRGDDVQVRQVVGPWVNKQPPYSTFFPDHCSQAQVVASIGYAYSQNPRQVAGAFNGPSAPILGAQTHCTGTAGEVLQLRGYLNLIGGTWILNTAYPLP
ncbi:EndoU domain-containing protein [Atopomonas hussainii]|uniref:EndoU domain-containing protein n=1 Tax=Atopomonas hussainii TaxID=1429083 RepID=UPI0008FFFC51|nr:EndoU domain-containing protein [Atopomonas hussainii]